MKPLVFCGILLSFCGISTLFAEEYAIPNTDFVLSYVVYDGEARITGCNADATGELIIPDYINDLPVTEIGSSSLVGRTGLTSIIFGNNVRDIGVAAMFKCSGLTHVTISDSVTVIRTRAFHECVNLTSITFGSGLEIIEITAFMSCSSLETVALPASLVSFDATAFAYCTQMESIEVDAANPNFSSMEGVLFNASLTELVRYPPNRTGPYVLPNTVESIARYAFSDTQLVAQITLSDGLLRIDEQAFSRSAALVHVVLPDTVTEVGFGAFIDCSSMVSFTLSNGMSSVPRALFSRCTSLTDIVVPEGVTRIEQHAFDGCSSLINISLPDSLNYIGQNAFSDCTSLETIVIPDGVSLIERTVFRRCAKLSNVTLPNSIQTLSRGLFQFCTSLAQIEIPQSITVMEAGLFENCTALASLTIPPNVNRIDGNITTLCENLQRIYVDGDNPYFTDKNGVLFNEAMTRLLAFPSGRQGSYVIPDGVISISDEAFYACNKLSALTLPDGLETIGYRSIAECKLLEELIIPSSVRQIGHFAFDYCVNMSRVTFLGNAPEVEQEIAFLMDDDFSYYFFEGASGFTTPTWLYLPAEELSAYDLWKEKAFVGIPRWTEGQDATDDFDMDGTTNIREFFFGRDPVEPTPPSDSLPVWHYTDNMFQVYFKVNKDAINADYSIETYDPMTDTWTARVTYRPQGASRRTVRVDYTHGEGHDNVYYPEESDYINLTEIGDGILECTEDILLQGDVLMARMVIRTTDR